MVVYILVISHCFIYLINQYIETSFLEYAALYFWENNFFAWYQLFSYTFLHQDLEHLLLNSCFLLVFGRLLNQVIGNQFFLIFYFVAGAFSILISSAIEFYEMQNYYANLIQTHPYLTKLNIITALNDSHLYNSWLADNTVQQLTRMLHIFWSPSMGASGVIYAVMTYYCLHCCRYLHKKVLMTFLLLTLLVSYDIVQAFKIEINTFLPQSNTSNHFGGIIFAVLTHFLVINLKKWKNKK